MGDFNMRKIAWIIFLAFLAWIHFYPEPVREVRQFTPAEKQRITAARKYHGNWPIEELGDRIVMITPRGIIKI
jgi:hypothetical protein